ncbi:myeloid cell surface antigen CD33-like [Anomaloglossus baeobatrachus]|uniref:myeloid cell surface antigen CD33-like n=1 Tax=Anomaloglossus baeobatrachus TaxID=238106 RepID=UPI003F4FED70
MKRRNEGKEYKEKEIKERKEIKEGSTEFHPHPSKTKGNNTGLVKFMPRSCIQITRQRIKSAHLRIKKRQIKPGMMWVSLVVILPLFWKAITCLVPGYSIRVTSSVSVQEGLCVTIPCKFTADSRNTFSNSSGYWIRRQEPLYPLYIVATNDKSSDVQKTNFHLTGNPDNGDCTLTITDAKKEDKGRYYYRFEESKVTNVKFHYSLYVTTTITVTDLKEEPVISDPGIMVSGINKTLTCAPPWNCPVASLVFQWRKSNVAGIWKKNTSTVTFTMYSSDHQENIICEMTNSMEKTTRKNIFLFLRDVCSKYLIVLQMSLIMALQKLGANHLSIGHFLRNDSQITK